MACKDTSFTGACLDTTLDGDGASGVAGVNRIFPNNELTERPLWDSVATEPARLAGTSLRLYSVRRAKNRHPLYAEPSNDSNEWEFHGPWEVMGAFAFDQATEIEEEVSPNGLQKVASAVLHISRKELEQVDAPDPKVGDVIHLWDRAPFDNENQFWDVTKANPDGNIFTSEAFVQFRLELRRRSRFDPGRKVIGERV